MPKNECFRYLSSENLTLLGGTAAHRPGGCLVFLLFYTRSSQFFSSFIRLLFLDSECIEQKWSLNSNFSIDVQQVCVIQKQKIQKIEYNAPIFWRGKDLKTLTTEESQVKLLFYIKLHFYSVKSKTILNNEFLFVHTKSFCNLKDYGKKLLKLKYKIIFVFMYLLVFFQIFPLSLCFFKRSEKEISGLVWLFVGNFQNPNGGGEGCLQGSI